MNILIIPTRYPNYFNAQSNVFYKDQAEALSQAGHNVSVLAVVPITIQEILKKRSLRFGYKVQNEKGVKTHTLTFPVFPKTKKIQQHLRAFIGKLMFLKFVKENQIPDIIHVHTFIAADLAIRLRNKYKIPFVITEHSSIFERKIATKYDINLAKKAYTNASKCIAVSKGFADYLKIKFNEDFTYVPNVVDTNFFTPLINENKNEFKILNVANLNSNKNHELLIKSFHSALLDQPNLKLRIGGCGPEDLKLKELVCKLGLENSVSLLGKLTRDQVKWEMQRCTVFALTSKYETFGVVLIEAMSCGKPVISTNSGGPSSIIKNGKNGILVNNEQSFKEELGRFIRDYPSFNLNDIRENTVAEFSNNAVVEKLLLIYLDVVK
jgi:glycosyltransferase involved in cell wall biosynthesis